MASIEILQQAFEKAKAAGDTEMAKKFAQGILDYQSNKPEVSGYTGGKEDDILTPLASGIMMGLSDEGQGVAAKFAQWMGILENLSKSDITGEEFSVYEAVRDKVRGDEKAFAEKHPTADTVAKVAGTLATGGIGGARLLGTEGVKKLGAFALPVVAAGEGATMGFGEGEGMEESLDKALTQGATSAVIAPAINKAIGVVGRYAQKGLAKIKRGETINSIEDLKIESQAFFDLAEESGIKIKSSIFKKFKKDLVQHFKDKGVNVIASPKNVAERGINPAILRMMKMDEPSYQDLVAIRNLLKSAKKGEGSVSDAAYDFSNMLDDFIDNLTPRRVSAGSVTDLSENISQAKSYWSRMKQSKTLANARKEAEMSEATLKEGDFDLAMRSEARKIVRPDARKGRGMGKETITDLESMILGSGFKNVIRGGAGMAPGSATARGAFPATAAGLGSMIGFSASGGNPFGLMFGMLPPALGAAFKTWGNRITRKEIDSIQDAVLNKNIDSLKTIMFKLNSKYGTGQKGAAAALAASSSGAVSSTLEDMISP